MTDRLPPSSEEAEQGVLGCILLSPVECLAQFQSETSPDAFYDERHKLLATVLIEMFDRNYKIDALTVQQRLKDRNELNSVGGLAYIASLPDMAPSAAHFGHYLSILVDKFERRRLLEVCNALISKVYQPDKWPTDQLVDTAEREILEIRSTKSTEVRPMIEIVREAAIKLEDYHQKSGMIGIPTGILDFDDKTGGLQGGEMIVIAGRPSTGKTALAMNIAEHIACDQKRPVGIFSLEMSDVSLAVRSICTRARLNIRDLRKGRLTEADYPKITRAAGEIKSGSFYIDDTAGLTVQAVRARARRMRKQWGCELFIIDYLQLLKTSKKCHSREQEIADISSGVKEIAKELNMPVLVLCQLNREAEKRGKPMLSDLRESGSIEQDADVVGLLYRDDERKGGTSTGIPVNLLIAKQRNGPTGDVPLWFRKDITRFENVMNGGMDE